jgi:hypothetical protein
VTSGWIKKQAPASLKNAAKAVLRDYRLWRAVREIARVPLGQIPTREMLSALAVGWGNPEYAAKVDYLHEVATRATTTSGPILECGSGLTTIMMGLLAGRRGVEIWSLEHSAEWHARITNALGRHRIPGVQMCYAPLREFNGFSWYDPPLATMPRDFSLVICDGPPGDTPGGRYGLLPLLRDYLSPGALILLDDAHRPSEQEVMSRWNAESKTIAQLPGGCAGTFAVIEVY